VLGHTGLLGRGMALIVEVAEQNHLSLAVGKENPDASTTNLSEISLDPSLLFIHKLFVFVLWRVSNSTSQTCSMPE